MVFSINAFVVFLTISGNIYRLNHTGKLALSWTNLFHNFGNDLLLHIGRLQFRRTVNRSNSR
jgi:hypothetical protein